MGKNAIKQTRPNKISHSNNNFIKYYIGPMLGINLQLIDSESLSKWSKAM
jgi:hypothetical protein